MPPQESVSPLWLPGQEGTLSRPGPVPLPGEGRTSGRGGSVRSATTARLSAEAPHHHHPALSSLRRPVPSPRLRHPAAPPAPTAPHSSTSRSRPRPSLLAAAARPSRPLCLLIGCAADSRARAHTAAGGRGGHWGPAALRARPFLLPSRPAGAREPRPLPAWLSSRLPAAAVPLLPGRWSAAPTATGARRPPRRLLPSVPGRVPPSRGIPPPHSSAAVEAGEGRREAEAAGERGSVRKEAGREGGGGGRAGEAGGHPAPFLPVAAAGRRVWGGREGKGGWSAWSGRAAAAALC